MQVNFKYIDFDKYRETITKLKELKNTPTSNYHVLQKEVKNYEKNLSEFIQNIKASLSFAHKSHYVLSGTVTNRQKAINWWNQLELIDKRSLVNQYKFGRKISSLTSREIEYIKINKDKYPHAGWYLIELNNSDYKYGYTYLTDDTLADNVLHKIDISSTGDTINNIILDDIVNKLHYPLNEVIEINNLEEVICIKY